MIFTLLMMISVLNFGSFNEFGEHLIGEGHSVDFSLLILLIFGTADDWLDRLTSASTSAAGTGQYNHTYVYDSMKACVAAYQTSDMSLLDSVYLGGSDLDYSYALDVDGNGHVYVTGFTDSNDFRQVHSLGEEGGGGDLFVARYGWDEYGLSLRFSTAIGGSDVDTSMGIAVDDAGHAYIAGYTYSGDYPTTPGDPPATNT